MAPAEVTEDYYAVLDVAPTATRDAIIKSYKRLALLRHPDRNRLSVNATAAFQLVRSPLPHRSLRSHTSLPVRHTIRTNPKIRSVEEVKGFIILIIMTPLASSKTHTRSSPAPPSARSTTAHTLASEPAMNPLSAAPAPRKPSTSAPPL